MTANDSTFVPRHVTSSRHWGWWQGELSSELLADRLSHLERPAVIVQTPTGFAVVSKGNISLTATNATPIAAILPPLPIASLGDPKFCEDHGLRYAYVTGAMANGIASADIVEAMSRAGMLGFYGAAGQSIPTITNAIERLQKNLGAKPFGINLIHSPNEPIHESKLAELLIAKQVRLVEASAYLDLTLPIIKYRLHGIQLDANGTIVTPNRVVAKVSRIEVASKFFAPAPEKFVRELVASGDLTPQQAELAKRVPVAQDLTVEADSGGHTDNRPLVTLLPTILALRDRVQRSSDYGCSLRVGAGGGISTPASAAAAFAMGAAYVVTGSVNQACVESGSSDAVRLMLAKAEQADVAMAPAADMFEMGVKLQVLKRGTMFAMRATKLYELYRAYPNLEALPANERTALEKNLFRTSLDEIWSQTQAFFRERDPSQLVRAEADAKYRMALVFRWYLGQSSRWANRGEAGREMDYQVWCGPSMGAFNEWARGSFLEDPKNRTVVAVALNLLYGAAMCLRFNQLRSQNVPVPDSLRDLRPIPLDELNARLNEASDE